MSERREPSLGEPQVVEDRDATSIPLSNAARRTSQLKPVSRRPRWPWLLGGTVALAVAIGMSLSHWRGAIASHLAPPQQNRLMQEAAAALVAGRLTSPDGHGARELYEAAMARDPDDFAAREGLVRVANAALAQAQVAALAHRVAQAQRNLVLARDLGAPVAGIQRVEEALRKDTGSEAQIAELLEKAAAAERAGDVDGTDGALALYQQAIAAAPDNAIVLDRRRALLARMLAGIDPLLARGDVDGAQKLVDRVAVVDPGHLDLPNARARVAGANQRVQHEQGKQLDRADADLRAGRIDDAVATWRRVIAQSPDQPRAHAGLRAAGEALVREANVRAANFEFAAAQSALDKARGLAPELPSLRATTQHLEQARMQRAGMVDRDGRDKAHLDDLLAQADHAIVRDELVDPPGDSAFDKLHAASAIAPGDPRVVAANRRFVATVAACVEHAMTENRLARASACLDALSATQPTYASLPSLRAALARRWIGYADERVGAGEFDTARHAVDSARRLAPDEPAVAAMAARVQQASVRH